MATAESTLDEELAPRPKRRGKRKSTPEVEAVAAVEAEPVSASVAVGILGRRHEVLGLLSLAATVLSGLALFSYDARATDNTIGAFGATLAGGLATLFGLAAWFVPLELGLLATRLFVRHRSSLGLARLASTFVVVLIGCAMVHLAMAGEEVMGGHLAGGLLGEMLGELMRALFGLVGAFVLGLTILLVTLILRTRVSLVSMSMSVAERAKASGRAARDGIDHVAQALREARELERLEEEATRARLAPKIVLRSSAGDLPAAADETPVEALEHEALVDVAPAPAVAIESKPDAKARPRTPKRPLAPAVVVEDEAALADELGVGIPVETTPARGVPTVSPAKAPTIVPPTPHAAPAAPAAGRPDVVAPSSFELPPTTLLEPARNQEVAIDAEALQRNADRLVEKLAAYGVKGRVDEIHPGPVVTMYELEPESGTKVSKIASLADDLAMALAAQKVRIVAPIPGKARVGFELPNKIRQMVSLREILEDGRWAELKAALPVAFGKDIAGQPVYGDLAKMPHLLVAGATGAGKSVGLNVMLASLLMKRTPDEVRLLMIDPKVVELAVFDGIPHMLLPVVTDMKKASLALRWAVDEMERRYQLFADAGARNITTYNERVDKVLRGELAPEKLMPRRAGKQVARGPEDEEVLVDPDSGESADAFPDPTRLPYVVVVVDEFADLMMVAAKDVEAAIARLAQKARAAGIHVILATQRPSVDVITGMIKANFPARIAFKVSQREDSKTILGRIGAEHLLGAGDMLMIPPGASDLRRVHSAYIGEDEVQAVCDHLRAQGSPVYDERIIAPREDEEGIEAPPEAEAKGRDALYDRAVAAVAAAGYCSISHLQRQLGVGYNKAAKLVEQMEKEGVVGPASGKAGGRREVLVGAL